MPEKNYFPRAGRKKNLFHQPEAKKNIGEKKLTEELWKFHAWKDVPLLNSEDDVEAFTDVNMPWLDLQVLMNKLVDEGFTKITVEKVE